MISRNGPASDLHNVPKGSHTSSLKSHKFPGSSSLGFSDLSVDSKEIVIGRKDLDLLLKLCREIYVRSKQHLM